VKGIYIYISYIQYFYLLCLNIFILLSNNFAFSQFEVPIGCYNLYNNPFKLHDFRSYGFPNNLETYGLISGLWTSTFALGAFIGPSVAGILLDNIGFRNASMFIVLLHTLVVRLIRFNSVKTIH